MIVQEIFCDVCGKKFESTYWDFQPASVTLNIGHPHQGQNQFHKEHVCHTCRNGILASVETYVANRQKQSNTTVPSTEVKRQDSQTYPSCIQEKV